MDHTPVDQLGLLTTTRQGTRAATDLNHRLTERQVVLNLLGPLKLSFRTSQHTLLK